MAKIIIGPEIGQVVKDGVVVRTDHMVWCEICLRKKVRNHQILSKADEKYVKSCLMKDWTVKEKDGKETRGKSCPRCRQTIVLQDNQWEEPKKA